MATRMQQRRGLASQWAEINPVLGTGEIGFETDTNKFKIGDGVSVWQDLSYFLDETALTGSLEDYVLLTDVGQPNGVASLDVDGQVPLSQLGNAPDPDLSAYATTAYVDSEIAAIPPTDLTGYATETYVNTAVSNLVDAAPAALDTLNELAAALGDDANFATTVTTSLGNKQDKVAGVSDTEISYLDGVTSAIQTQINDKMDKSEQTFHPFLMGI